MENQKKIDVIYKLGSGSKRQNDELRYSLRSLSNFKNLGKVYLVGIKPAWVTNITWIEAQDPFEICKDCNLISKIILACLDKDITQQFLHFSDDQVLLSPINLEYFERPLINNKYLNDVSVPGKKLNRWQRRLWRTFEVLKKNNLKFDCYEAHAPYLVDKTLFPETLLKYDFGYDLGYTGNTLYFNTIGAKGKMIGAFDMLRLEKQQESVQAIQTLAKDKLMLNYTDSAINNVLFDYLKQLFPDKSQYEI